MQPIKWIFVLLMLFSFSVFAENAYKVQNNALVLPVSIQFDSHAYDVKNTSDPMLDFVAQYLKDKRWKQVFEL